MVKATFFGASDTGRVRKNNEDNFIAQYIWDERHILCAAIDGIGGYEGGEVAAGIARDVIIRYLEDFPSGKRLEQIKSAVIEANNEIVRQKQSDPMYSRMGCVATAGLIDLDEMVINVAHVGDSRLYQYAGGVLTKLSHDHSLVGYREEIGELTEEEAMHHPQRNMIERCIGDTLRTIEDKHFVDAGIFPINGDTQFLFCSDGLSDMLTSAQIKAELHPQKTAEQEVKALIDDANAMGGKDNVTVVIASITGSTRPQDTGDICQEDLQDRGLQEFTIDEPPSESETSPTIAYEPEAKKKHIISGMHIAGLIMISLIIGTVSGYLWASHGYGNKTKIYSDSILLLKKEKASSDMRIRQLEDSIDTLSVIIASSQITSMQNR